MLFSSFLGFWLSYRQTFDIFSTAQALRNPNLSLLSFYTYFGHYGTKTDIQLALIEPAQLLQNLFQQLKQAALNQYLLKTSNSNF
jgi:hypothetical protein